MEKTNKPTPSHVVPAAGKPGVYVAKTSNSIFRTAATQGKPAKK